MMMLKPEPIMIIRASARVSLNPIMILPVVRRPASRHPIMILSASRARAFHRMMMMMMMTLLRVFLYQRIVCISGGRTSCAMATSNGYGTAVNGRGVQFPAP